MIDYSLYLVTDDPSRYRGNWLDQVAAAVAGGVTCVQYRDTESSRQVQYERILELRKVLGTVPKNVGTVPIIINNDAELAAAVKADGVHIGQHDLPPAKVRQLVGPDCEIGVSITSMADLRLLQSDAPRTASGSAAGGRMACLGIGPVFDARQTKADASDAVGVEGLRSIVAAARSHAATAGCKLVAIGGIKLENAAAVLATGVDGLAVVSGFSRSSDPKSVAEQFRKL